ncbi:MAG: hypothetical protein J7L61_01360 [Thermoplasmata archaeon]|nr:hypothetical protein [Thermoplasmata archaeon]
MEKGDGPKWAVRVDFTSNTIIVDGENTTFTFLPEGKVVIYTGERRLPGE